MIIEENNFLKTYSNTFTLHALIVLRRHGIFLIPEKDKHSDICQTVNWKTCSSVNFCVFSNVNTQLMQTEIKLNSAFYPGKKLKAVKLFWISDVQIHS